MAEVSRPDYTFQWSSGGAIVAPSNTKIQTGWTAEVPPFQWENWSQNRQDNAIVHLLQKGISTWSSTQDYYFSVSGPKSYVQGSDGVIYVALQNSTNQNPTTPGSTFWKVAFPNSGRLLRISVYTLVGGVLKVSVNGAAPVNAAGTFTPIAGAVNAIAEVIGGGGGGGGCNGTGTTQVAAAAGGGAGGYAASWLPISSLSSVTLSVGAGGGSAANSAGASGSTSAIGGLLSATGGGGGTIGVAITTPNGTALSGSGVGGVGSNGNLLVSQGGFGTYGAQAPSPISGAGGASILGSGAPFVSGTSNGQAAVTPGSGGSGSSLLSNVAGGAAGGAGAAGMIKITEYS